MKAILTQGISYLEELEGSAKWFWGTDYIHGDLYEAEERFNAGDSIKSNRLVFVHYPDGTVIEPIAPQDGQYFGRPIYFENNIIVLLVDFPHSQIKLLQYHHESKNTALLATIPLTDVKDCYNLMLKQSPLMLTRQGDENQFEILYPEKMQFDIGSNESFYFREDDRLYFSAWYDDEEPSEGITIREISTGNVIDKIPGVIRMMPDGQKWIIT